jgi:outer membrane protein assembly factor BamB
MIITRNGRQKYMKFHKKTSGATCATLSTSLVLALGALLYGGAASAAEDYWPGLLGPKRDGRVSDFRSPKKWPAKLTKVWRIKVGSGYGSPLVAKGRVWQHAREGEDEIIHCLDLATGKSQWSKRYPTPFKMGGGADRHGKGPKSSPVYADGRVFVMSITGTLSAWDAASGKALWKSSLGKRFKVPHPYWGSSNSPIVDGNLVIAHFGNDEKGVLAALDVATGKELWTQGNDGTCYSSPLLADHYGIRQVIEWNHRAIVGVESKTGRLLWEYPFPHKTHNQNMPTPTFHDGQILVGGENRGIHGLSPKLKDGKWTVTKNWSQMEVALDMSSAIVADGLLFGMSHYKSGQLFCLDPKNGKILWSGPPRVGNNVAFLSVPGYVLALINTGEVRIIKATGQRYEQVASYRVADGGTWAPPVLLQRGILVKDREYLALWAF